MIGSATDLWYQDFVKYVWGSSVADIVADWEIAAGSAGFDLQDCINWTWNYNWLTWTKSQFWELYNKC